MLVRLKIRRYVLRAEKRFDGSIGTVDAKRPPRGFELDEMFLVARALESQRIEPACERAPRMNRAARSIERGASALGFKFQHGTSANGITGDRFAGAETSGAGEAKDVVRGKRDDLIMTASSALVTEVGKFALPVHFFQSTFGPPCHKVTPVGKLALRFIGVGFGTVLYGTASTVWCASV